MSLTIPLYDQTPDSIDTNGFDIMRDRMTLAFYAARNTSTTTGPVLTSHTTYWFPNGNGTHTLYAQNFFNLTFESNNSLRWTWAEQGNYQQLTWPNVIPDNQTHHYIFYVEASLGQGFGDVATIHLYVDGQYRGSQQIQHNIPPIYLNYPAGVGSAITGPGTPEYVQPFNQMVSYGAYGLAANTLTDFGQLWVGLMPAGQLGTANRDYAVNNLWNNGWQDLGPAGTRGRTNTVQPYLYENFGYAGAGYLASTGLASRFTLTCAATQTILSDTISANAQSTLAATARRLRYSQASLAVTASETASVSARRSTGADITANSTASTDNRRIRTATINLTATTSSRAIVSRLGQVGDFVSTATMTVQDKRLAGLASAVSGSSSIQIQAERVRNSAAQLTDTTALSVQPIRSHSVAVAISTVSQLTARPTAHNSGTSAMASNTSMTILTADYRLTVDSTLTAWANYKTTGRAGLTSDASVQTQATGIYDLSIDLVMGSSEMILADSIAPGDFLVIDSETRMLTVQPETRELQIDSETRMLSAKIS